MEARGVPLEESRLRTRTPDRLTDAFLLLTGARAVWAVALVVLTFLAIVQPQFFYSDQKSQIHAVLASSAFSAIAAKLLLIRSGPGCV